MGAVGPECVAVKVEVSDLRASAGISIGAVVRLLDRGVMAGSVQVCFTVTKLVCMWPMGVRTELTGLELVVTGKVPSGRIKCKLLPTSMTAVPRGMQFTYAVGEKKEIITMEFFSNIRLY